MRKKLIIFIVVLCFMPACSYATELAGLSDPESVVIDPGSGDIFVSNVNGAPLEKDDNGYISRISKDRVVVVLKFMRPGGEDAAFHAPKGMAIEDGLLYVADIDTVKVFDVGTGRIESVIGFGNFKPQFLNDIASDGEGAIYVSDMVGNRIYRIDLENDYEITIFKEGEELGGPNGLLVLPRSRGLLVASWSGGRLLEISPQGEIEILRSDMEEGLDGITANRHLRTLYVSSFSAGEIYEISEWGRGELRLFRTGLITPADIYFDSKEAKILVPHMKSHKLMSYGTKE